MIVSRCITLGKLNNNVVKTLLFKNVRSNVIQQVKHHGHDTKFYYRKYPTGPLPDTKAVEIVQGIVWWWVLWHCFTSYHVFIPQKFPDPEKWTDEELGVPPLEE